MDNTPVLEIQNVSKKYAKHTALSDVSLRVEKGQLHGLIGPNGAGKTTLIRIINQIIAPDEGHILFSGKPLNSSHTQQIGYLPEERGLYKKMKIIDQLIYLGQLKGLSKREAKTRMANWMKRLGMENWADKKVDDLSKGMQQKIQFIATVFHEPELIILDEPFSGFDPVNAKLIQDEILRLHQNGSTIIYSTHRMESVEQLCTHLSMINRSKIILNGSLQEIKASFKTSVYNLIYSTDHSNIEELIEKHGEIVEKEENVHETNVKLILKEGFSLNDVLNAILPHALLHEVKEISPSVEDIFIDQVTQNN